MITSVLSIDYDLIIRENSWNKKALVAEFFKILPNNTKYPLVRIDSYKDEPLPLLRRQLKLGIAKNWIKAGLGGYGQ